MSGSPWTLYWYIDTPLSTVREELKSTADESQAKALSLCLPLSISLLLRYTSLSTLSLTCPLSGLSAPGEGTAELPSHTQNTFIFLPYPIIIILSCPTCLLPALTYVDVWFVIRKVGKPGK